VFHLPMVEGEARVLGVGFGIRQLRRYGIYKARRTVPGKSELN